MPIGPYHGDLTDTPLTQMAIGTVCGYLAGLTRDRDAVLVCGATMAAYRLVHHMGFIELNIFRRRKNKRSRRRSDENEKWSFLRENHHLMTGLAGGYAAAVVQTRLM